MILIKKSFLSYFQQTFALLKCEDLLILFGLMIGQNKGFEPPWTQFYDILDRK